MRPRPAARGILPSRDGHRRGARGGRGRGVRVPEEPRAELREGGALLLFLAHADITRIARVRAQPEAVGQGAGRPGQEAAG